MRRLLIVGDSLALPRGQVRFEQTWPNVLAALRPDLEVVNVSRRGLVSSQLLTEGQDVGYPAGSDFLEFYAPELVAVQIGIVESFPRLFSRRSLEYRFLSKLPEGLRKRYIAAVKKYRHKKRDFAFSSPEVFRSNLELFLERCKRCSVSTVVFLPILHSGINGDQSDLAWLQQYNAVLSALAQKGSGVEYLTVAHTLLSDDYLSDGYHLSASGSKKIANLVSKEITT